MVEEKKWWRRRSGGGEEMVEEMRWWRRRGGGREEVVEERRWWRRGGGGVEEVVEERRWWRRGGGGGEEVVEERRWWKEGDEACGCDDDDFMHDDALNDTEASGALKAFEVNANMTIAIAASAVWGGIIQRNPSILRAHLLVAARMVLRGVLSYVVCLRFVER